LFRDLSTDEEADEHLIDHLCKQGATDKDPAKPSKPALLSLLQKYIFLRDIIVAVFRLRKGDVLVFIPPPTLYKEL
jgi:hypothetical protein